MPSCIAIDCEATPKDCAVSSANYLSASVPKSPCGSATDEIDLNSPRGDAQTNFVPILHRWYATSTIASGAVLTIFCLVHFSRPWAAATGPSPLFPTADELRAAPSLLARVLMVASSHLFATHFFAAVLLLMSLMQGGGDFSSFSRLKLVLLISARSAVLGAACRRVRLAVADLCVPTIVEETPANPLEEMGGTHLATPGLCFSLTGEFFRTFLLFQFAIELLFAVFVLFFIRYHRCARQRSDGVVAAAKLFPSQLPFDESMRSSATRDGDEGHAMVTIDGLFAIEEEREELSPIDAKRSPTEICT